MKGAECVVQLWAVPNKPDADGSKNSESVALAGSCSMHHKRTYQGIRHSVRATSHVVRGGWQRGSGSESISDFVDATVMDAVWRRAFRGRVSMDEVTEGDILKVLRG